MDRRPLPVKLLSFSGPTKSFDASRIVLSRATRERRLYSERLSSVIDVKPNIKDLSFKELTAFLSEHHHPVYRAKQVWQWLFQKRAITFAEMTNLSRSLREQLDENFSIGRLQTLRRAESRDGTVKFLFGLADEASIESVLIPEPRRLTLCVSTQAGCGFGCAFCATAVLGLKRNLTASEIVDQILEASRTLSDDGRITHVVLMGMGEPLANYDQTVKSAANHDRWRVGHRYLAAPGDAFDGRLGTANRKTHGRDTGQFSDLAARAQR